MRPLGGDVATVGILVDACALCLDGRVVSDAFSRAWDRGDPARLCSVDGWLWPRCQTSRWYVLEKLAKIEEATLMAAAANGLWIDEVSEIVEAVGNSMTLILADAVSADVDMEEHGMRLRVGPISSLLMGTSGSDPNNRTELGQSGFSNQMASTLFGMKPLYPTLWRPKRSFLDRTIDSFVAVSSAKSVDLVLSYRPEVHPRHLSAAIDRGNLTILNLLVEHGANPSWPEDTTLAHLVTRPPSDGVASLFWRHALTIGVVITPRRWEKIAKLGPRTVAAVLETSRALSPAYSISEAADQTGFEPTSRHREVRTTTGGGRSQSMMTKSVAIDPCRDGMAGFRVGGSEVIRCLADAMDATFPCGDALAAAALGDPRALDYCVRVGDVLADMLREGRKEHCCDLLDAGAIVLEDVLALAAAIADAPPGGWEEWPIAARCFRRILVQRRLRLPIPNAHALNELPRTVVTTAFLASLYATRPLLSDRQATVYSQYQRRRHPNTAGIRINLVPVLEYDVSFNVIQSAMEALRELLALYDDPVYPGEAYCFIKGMLQYGLRDKNLLREEDEFILPDDEWEEVALALTTPN
ncbi:hypothetical protein DFJ73DRAFT_432859 [Zopfochytrium polystomum]|nr:hypothetical protein DFJ73DRAFT_432859 [Zopfochytrium polystomum]